MSDPKLGNTLGQFQFKAGDPVSAGKLNALVRELARNHIDISPQGRRVTVAGDTGGAGEVMQFDVYQVAATPSVPASDWRNVRVSAGRLYNFAVTGTAADILIPASATAYKIWMQATIALFAVSTAAITHAATVATTANWKIYPDIATTTDNSGTGHFPARRYILIAEITTSDDTLKQITITQHWRGPMAVPMPVIYSDGGGCYIIA